MPLHQTHIGWENEHLATFLLSRISFVSKPLTVGDDIGVDLICTLFEIAKNKSGCSMLIPKNALAVQVKSSRKAIEVTSKTEYLGRLAIPYFVAVVNKDELLLDLYSGRYLPHMFSYRSSPKKLKLLPIKELGGNYRSGDDEKGYTVGCPKVISLSTSDSMEELKRKSTIIQREAAAALQAIVSRQNYEFIFTIPDGLEVFTGKDSAQAFRENYYMRLAEALHNIAWLRETSHFIEQDEVNAYLEAYKKLSAIVPIPIYLKQAFDRLGATGIETL